MANFNVEIDKAFAKIDTYIDDFMQEFVKQFAEELVFRTPVYKTDGGFLQSNWRFSVGTPMQGKPTPSVRKQVPNSFHESYGYAASLKVKATDTVWITNTTDYARTNEYGLSFYAPRNFTGSTVAIADQIAQRTKARLKK
jgi:hypothetical protein